MLKDKNILYIVHNYTSFQKDQIEEASRHFNKVYVLVRYKLVTVIANALKLKVLQKYREENCIDTHDLPDNVEVFKTPVSYIPYGPIYKLVGNFHYKAVKKVVEENDLKFDIVHSHFLWSAGYAGMKIAQEYSVPFVVTGHGYDVYSLPFKDKEWNSKIKEVVDYADEVITISSFNKKFLEKIVKDEKKIDIVYNGFSPELFYPQEQIEARKELGLDNGKRICVTAGNLIKIKGFCYLIKAMSLLSEEYADVDLYIIGAGHEDFKLKNSIKKYKLKDRVFLKGIRPHAEIAKWMNAADLFVISSLKEGAPVVLLESLACGTPVVGTKVGIVEETLEAPKYGFVCDIKDPKGLSSAIEKGLSKSWSKEDIAQYGQQFTWAKANEKIVKIYSKLLEDK
ncbi:MAG: Glycosyl transferase group 1 [candidate division WS6 bacterium GW2011_GWF1_35_23]|uniref:Glycosyl transferase group 1 n=1 Tax=candidate division WS6 bacterium GW2011_GWF1_35_23 TaxID=1619097 RepID=A0A0G0CK10_9BACT|nr:MAG: Glycosyl transferase group 1 [candidate division WS6 bacterium GW2011_GWF1_35_23]